MNSVSSTAADVRADPAWMPFARVDLNHFRKFENASFSFHPSGLTLITGPNGAGKSTILEAVYLLCMGRAPRDTRLQFLIHRLDRPSFFRVDAFAAGQNAADSPARSVSFLDGSAVAYRESGRPVRRTDIIGRPPIVLFSAEELRLISGEPALRRRMMDRVLSQSSPDYLARLKRYTRAIEERNALMRDAFPSSPDAAAWLALDETVAADGAELMTARRELIADISATVPDVLRSLGSPALAGRVSIELGETVKGPYLGALIDARPNDRAAGHSTIGPHRDDIRFIDMSGNTKAPAAEMMSQGETRILALAMKLIEAKRLASLKSADSPSSSVLLCDDIFSELDESRLEAVTAFLSSYPGQVLLTSCIDPPASLTASIRSSICLG